MAETLRTETIDGVRRITLCRPEAYNTITPTLRDELDTALRDADNDPEARVVLLDAEGPAFCAGYGLDWATPAQAAEHDDHRLAPRVDRGGRRTAHEAGTPILQ